MQNHRFVRGKNYQVGDNCARCGKWYGHMIHNTYDDSITSTKKNDDYLTRQSNINLSTMLATGIIKL